MTSVRTSVPQDTPQQRKQRGAFFTPGPITRFITAWAVRSPADRVLEPSAGDAGFLVAAVDRLRGLAPSPSRRPRVDGVEIHPYSAQCGRRRVEAAGGAASILERDFFAVAPEPVYDSVIGNPPYIRYQGFTSESRARSRQAALRAGVALTGLASSWAAFTVHSALFLKRGGRLGLVLPAELLSVNYAAPVRKFLLESFARVELVLFDEQVFPEAAADVVLLLAEGYGDGPTDHAVIRQARNAEDLASLGAGQHWVPPDPAGKWTGSLVTAEALAPLGRLVRGGMFAGLQHWGETTLGIVTGNNKYFALSPQRVAELGLPDRDLLRVSPPGSAHLRGLSLTGGMLRTLGAAGKATSLFSPAHPLSPAARAYIEAGHKAGVDTAYKCRVRKTWYQVPVIDPADLLLTCMNADTPRLTTNRARAHHLNSVHGVYLADEHRGLGRALLPLASLNSLTLLNAEMVGRTYGGGILKIEPREADVWAMPTPALVSERARELAAVKDKVAGLLRSGRLMDAVEVVDEVLLRAPGHASAAEVDAVRHAHAALTQRRTVRGASGR